MKITRRSAIASMASAAVAMPFVQRARAQDAQLNVYNWADYIGETTIEDFQSATGIAVTYDTYSSAEEMQAKMLAGSTGYDVVDMSGLELPRFIKAGVYEKLDRSKLPGWGNLDPEVMRILSGWDPGNEYAIPYMWGSVGITYNVDMVKERLPDADLDVARHDLQARECRQACRLRHFHSRQPDRRHAHDAALSRQGRRYHQRRGL